MRVIDNANIEKDLLNKDTAKLVKKEIPEGKLSSFNLLGLPSKTIRDSYNTKVDNLVGAKVINMKRTPSDYELELIREDAKNRVDKEIGLKGLIGVLGSALILGRKVIGRNPSNENMNVQYVPVPVSPGQMMDVHRGNKYRILNK